MSDTVEPKPKDERIKAAETDNSAKSTFKHENILSTETTHEKERRKVPGAREVLL